MVYLQLICFPKEVVPIAITSASLPAKRRILTVCVKLFLEKGYKRTTVAEIVQKADVSNSTFQNIFRAKDGVLTELVEFMFDNQFGMARRITDADLPPVFVYAVETAIQLTLTELNENLREIYIEAYTQNEASEYIFRQTAKELHAIFGSYHPEMTERDFYIMELGSAGIMRGYMAHPCSEDFPLEEKLDAFFRLSLGGYGVPAEEIERAEDSLARHPRHCAGRHAAALPRAGNALRLYSRHTRDRQLRLIGYYNAAGISRSAIRRRFVTSGYSAPAWPIRARAPRSVRPRRD